MSVISLAITRFQNLLDTLGKCGSFHSRVGNLNSIDSGVTRVTTPFLHRSRSGCSLLCVSQLILAAVKVPSRHFFPPYVSFQMGICQQDLNQSTLMDLSFRISLFFYNFFISFEHPAACRLFDNY